MFDECPASMFDFKSKSKICVSLKSCNMRDLCFLHSFYDNVVFDGNLAQPEFIL